ncbi:hypothetical protein FGO68_gene4964 [Halteria grandinella]|uniref:Uncharacterized protein n=1 Tax=Halteria grandinella TaxID=5974 RepID=A0A8J8NS41_HALGN|nr:hypothetical protein FGO68_gene4964 [Halteria grandinella]
MESAPATQSLFQPGTVAPAEKKPTTGRSCQGVCCACRPIRVMRDNCLKNNEEFACISFVDAFKQCIDTKRAEVAARRAAQAAIAAANSDEIVQSAIANGQHGCGV